jgi:hypothetical protein
MYTQPWEGRHEAAGEWVFNLKWRHKAGLRNLLAQLDRAEPDQLVVNEELSEHHVY